MAEADLLALGATIGPHPRFGRADIVASHPDFGLYLVEVEGTSSRQREQAMYSALGQLTLQMDGGPQRFVLAVPDEPAWERQVLKIPPHCRQNLRLSCILVGETGIRDPWA